MALDIFGLPTALLTDIGGVEVDAIISENHRYNVLVTENPVEDGSNVSDHIVNLPFVLDLEGRFTDTPFGFLSSVSASAVGLLSSSLGTSDIVAGLTTATTAALLGESRPGLSKTKYNLLVALQSAREVIEVVTGMATYNNMVIESLSAPRVSRDGRSVKFNATLKEIIIVGDEAETNRERVISSLWATALTPRQLGIVQKAEAAFNPLQAASP